MICFGTQPPDCIHKGISLSLQMSTATFLDFFGSFRQAGKERIPFSHTLSALPKQVLAWFFSRISVLSNPILLFDHSHPIQFLKCIVIDN
jgi:hypothetical protein